MKSFVVLLIAFCILSHFSASAQRLNVPKDSIPSLLCKKWVSAYVQMNGQQIAPNAGAEMVLEFHSDHSLVFSENGNSSKGTWAYSPTKNVVLVTINGLTMQSVVDLTPTQMTTVMNSGNSTTGGAAGGLSIVYKVKAS